MKNYYASPGFRINGFVTWSARYSFYLYPIIWFIGAAQFLWYFIFLPVAAGFIIGKVRPQRDINLFCIGAGLFILAALTSMISMVNVPSFRWITYVRDLLTYTIIFSIILWSSDKKRGWSSLEPILKASIFAIGLAAIIGNIAWLFQLKFAFSALLSNLVPGSLASTGLGQAVLSKSVLTHETWLFGHFMPRAKSLFLYSNTYAAILELSAPFALFYAITTASLSRFYYAFLFLAMLFGLYTTTSRSGMFATILGMLFLLSLLASRYASRRAIVAFFMLEVGVLVIALIVIYVLYFNAIKNSVEIILYARGSGSLDTRSAIYLESISWGIRNLIGYGVNRNVAGIQFPLGSHSQYIGVFFKYGLLGIIAWALMLYSIGLKIYYGVQFSSQLRDKSDWWFYVCAATSFFIILIHQATLELTLDLPVAVVFGLTIGSVVARGTKITAVPLTFTAKPSA